MADEQTTRILSDPQDPLPEASWFWRRVFVFAVTAAVLWMVWGAVARLGAASLLQPERGIPALLSLCKSLLFLVLVMVTYYMVAPSAEQITKMIQTAGLLKHGVQIASRAVAETPEHREETQATVGLPPQPVVPPQTADAPAPSPDTPEAPDALPDAPWAAESTERK